MAHVIRKKLIHQTPTVDSRTATQNGIPGRWLETQITP